MSDYSNGSKDYGTTVYPVHANGTSGLLKRVEPLLTPDLFKSRHMKGIFERLPKSFQMSNEEIKDQINLAINELEIEINVPVFAEQFREKHPYDATLYKSFIHIVAQKGPIISIEDFTITSANRINIFRIPPTWVETAQFHQRQINVVPLLAAYGINQIAGSVASGGIAFLTSLGGLGNVPSYWEIVYTAGMCRDVGTVPVTINQIIGTIAAINTLSPLALANPNTSVSLGQDGISQATSGPGANIYATRMAELQLQRANLMKQLKKVFSQKYLMSSI
jgi:hypothetical protein